MSKIISYPQMGNYSTPIYYLLRHVLHIKVLKPDKITNRTIELGTKYSPDFVCTPFKYTLGTFIENLDKGSDVLLQLGGGCRYGYYSELQELILKDLGYNFTYINLVSKGKTDLFKIYKKIKEIDPEFKLYKGIYYLFITIKMVKYMDKVDDYIRRNIGFGDYSLFNKIYKEMLANFGNIKNYISLCKIYNKYFNKIKAIEVVKNKPLKVGIIGELYTIMESFANYELETILASYNIEITRFTSATYLLFEKKKKAKEYIKYADEYIKYKMGADAHDNIGRCKWLCENNYDGIIHIKSSFCTPEIGAMPIINKICKKYNVPIIYFSFDSSTEEGGFKTRIEAFVDMIKLKCH